MLHLYRQHSHSLVPCSSTIITVSRWVLVATSSSNYQIFSYYASQQYDIINQWKCVQELRRFLLQQTKDSIQCNMSNGYFFKKVVAEQLLTFLQGPYFCWALLEQMRFNFFQIQHATFLFALLERQIYQVECNIVLLLW